MNLRDINYLGIERVLRRGSGKVIEEYENALLVFDHVSRAYFLACEDKALGISLLDKHNAWDFPLLMTSNYEIGKTAFERYAFQEKLDCYQVAYFGEKPDISTRLVFRVADNNDVPQLMKVYDMISAEEMYKVVNRKSLILGYEGESLAGFIGEHLEGSMGMLYVFPEFRGKGYGTELERKYIADTMERGFIPFGQVEKNNVISLALQKKLGMTQSENLICWMWRSKL